MLGLCKYSNQFLQNHFRIRYCTITTTTMEIMRMVKTKTTTTIRTIESSQKLLHYRQPSKDKICHCIKMDTLDRQMLLSHYLINLTGDNKNKQNRQTVIVVVLLLLAPVVLVMTLLLLLVEVPSRRNSQGGRPFSKQFFQGW